MKKRNIAVLLTSYNRKSKTIACLKSLYQATIPAEYLVDVFLLDDGSTDGTEEAVKELFHQIHLIRGNGSLFWAGGMRLAWETAMNEKSYDVYLLINDDVVLQPGFIMNMIKAENYSIAKTGKAGIYTGATVDSETGRVTYGGSRIKNNLIVVRLQLLTPGEQPQRCDITNANVLWVSKNVVERIGIFDHRYIHGIADYDYSLQARKKKFPVVLAPGVCGVCNDDHGNNWRSNQHSLKERIAYLKSPKGLAYDEYLYYIGKHFPMSLPYTFVMLWMKTLFPSIWDRLKN